MSFGLPDRGNAPLSDVPPGELFARPEVARAMAAEHRPLWAAFLRAISERITPGARVLDFGCNQGGLLAVLRRGYERIWRGVEPSLAVGMDLDTPAMRALLAAAARAEPGVLFTTAPAADFPAQFDLVLSHEVIYLLPDPGATFAELASAMAAGAWLCLATGCHRENPFMEKWQQALERDGVRAFRRAEAEYEAALRGAGFRDVGRARLLLSDEEYECWVSARSSREPNPDWFAGAAEERDYYTRFGKMILLARRDRDGV